MKLRKILLILLAFSLVLTLTMVGAVFAYMYRQTETVTNYLVPAYVDCVVVEEFANSTKSAINVRNTGNIDAYLRVRLVTYWVNDAGEIVAEPSQMPEIHFNNGWIKGTGNTYYYESPVAPGETPPVNLLSESITLTTANDGKYRQVIEVFAEAIQSKPTGAVTGSWGVTVTDGKITDAP